ncbi:MAG: tetratricopeptide repeat protein [bacterium]|nr:tetratricopeptide repeat protein [bacterium]
MNIRLPYSTVLLLGLAGCSALSSGSVRLTDGASVEVGRVSKVAEATPVEGAPQEPEPQDPRPVQAPSDQDRLEIWGDIEFRRAFAESYLPDTEIEPAITQEEREAMQEILGAIADKRLEWAREQLQTLVGATSTAMFEFTLGNVHFESEKFGEAADAYDDAIKKHQKFPRAWKNLGICHVRLGDFASAADAFAHVLQYGKSDAVTYGLLGYSYSMIEDHVAAESAYRMASLFDPASADWRIGLAKSLFKQKRFGAVASLLDSLLKNNSHDGQLWLLQANAFLGMEDTQKAAENFEIVDELGQSTPESLNTLGDIYVNDGMYELAVGAYTRALDKDRDPKVANIIRNAKVLISRNAMDQGKRLLEVVESRFAALIAGEDKKDLLKLRARIAMTEGASDDQAKILEEIVTLDPLDGEALILLAQHYGRKGDVDRAILYYENAANVPDFEADAKVRHAQLLVREGRYAEALPLLRRAQLLKPRDNVREWLEKVERYAEGGGS